VRVEDDPEPLEIAEGRAPHLRAVLADAAGEDDGVQLPERGVVGVDVLAHAVGVDVERERRRPSPAARRWVTPRKSWTPKRPSGPDSR
jgi:hypothetical protein